MIVHKKRLISVSLAILIILLSSVTGYAAVQIELDSPPNIQPFWVNTSEIGIVLSITDGKAVLSASVEGYSGVTKITAVAILERLNFDGTYTEIERWDNIISNSYDLDWTSTRYVAKGYTYRFTFTPTVYKNGVSETVSGSKSTWA